MACCLLYPTLLQKQSSKIQDWKLDLKPSEWNSAPTVSQDLKYLSNIFWQHFLEWPSFELWVPLGFKIRAVTLGKSQEMKVVSIRRWSLIGLSWFIHVMWSGCVRPMLMIKQASERPTGMEIVATHFAKYILNLCRLEFTPFSLCATTREGWL